LIIFNLFLLIIVLVLLIRILILVFLLSILLKLETSTHKTLVCISLFVSLSWWTLGGIRHVLL
jgi:hypothetical protein